jgi:hypothetical protein
MVCKIVKGPQNGRMRQWGEGRRLENEFATPSTLVLLLTMTKNKNCLALSRELHVGAE